MARTSIKKLSTLTEKTPGRLYTRTEVKVLEKPRMCQGERE